jgi:hypothetical protein
MNKKLLLAAVLTAAIAPVLAQQKTQPPPDPDKVSIDATTVCHSTFTSGSGSNYLKFCVTENGNITEFQSPQGFEAIDEGAVYEGYGVCDLTGGDTRYYDYAAEASTNWLPATISGSSLPITIKRTTSDGIWTLTQVINRNTTDPAVTITMTLKNNTGISRYIGLLRYADIDANNANGGTFDNYFDFDHESAWGYNTPSLATLPPPPSTNRFGVMLYSDPTSVPHWAFAQNVSYGPDPCLPNNHLASTPFYGDGSVAVEWAQTIGPGNDLKVESEYRRF